MKNKRQNRQGCYLLRESHLNYDEYCLDVCLEEGEQATTFFIEKSAEGCTFKGLGGKTYPSIPELLTNHQEVTKKIPGFDLKECLPPSENGIHKKKQNSMSRFEMFVSVFTY